MQLLRADRGRCRFLPFALRAAPSKKTDLNAEQAHTDPARRQHRVRRKPPQEGDLRQQARSGTCAGPDPVRHPGVVFGFPGTAELLFGRGLGEMFIVRNADNTVDTTALGLIE